MSGNHRDGISIWRLLRRTLATGLGALQNRGELFVLELQEEKARVIKLAMFGTIAVFLGIMTMLLITGTVIMLFPDAYRLYAVGGFAALYLAGTIWAALRLKAMLRKIPFGDTLAEFKKDSELMEAFSE